MRFGNYHTDYTFLIMAAAFPVIPFPADAPMLRTGAIVAVIIGVKKIEHEG
ncbi:MAG TPA: hypothetical protein H9994_06640 [Candidatus Salinicoccus merdavium]|nr:hypothetical protein [Candidatus Salinicoccus merdavium]